MARMLPNTERTSKYITIFKWKKDGKAFVVGDVPLTGFFDNNEFEKEYKIIEVNNLNTKQTLVNSAYYLTSDKNSITNTQYDLLTVACAKKDIHTRKLSNDECKEVIRNTHGFIHYVLELDEFKLTDDNGDNPKTFKWSEWGKIFIDQNITKNK